MTSAWSCLVLCAGKGTRMKSRLPKVLHPILGRPLAAYPVECAHALGASAIVAVVGHEAERVEQELRGRLPGLRFALQAEQRGTGHAVQVGLSALRADSAGSAVLVLYGDTPLLRPESLRALLDAREAAGAPLALLTTRLAQPAGYGRIVRDEQGRVVRIVEHKDATAAEREICEVNPGIYAFDPAFLATHLAGLSTTNAQGELYLTDLVEIASRQGGVVDLDVPAEDTLGINDRVQLAEAARVLSARIREAHMRAGVTLEDPDSTHIDADVQLGQDVVLGPNVVLRGTTALADDVTVGPGCVLTNTRVERGATLHPYTVCEGAFVGERAEAGPFARLRPDALLMEGAKVGNFVEVKKARLGKGAKANHLSYLGDADIGEGTNVGAGTITCNYDGHGKHKTVLGSGVFIGSNSTLVAPLLVADGAYVAAGSCVTREVPGDALAISRPKQENKEGYAARIRARNAARAGKPVRGA